MAIPLPSQPGDAFLKGAETGSSMFTRIMQPILQRQQMAMQQQQMEQQQQQHLRNAAIREQQEARLGQMMPYQIKNMLAQISHREQQGANAQQEMQLKQRQMNQADQMMPIQIQNMQSQADFNKAKSRDMEMNQQLISQFMNQQGGQQDPSVQAGFQQNPFMQESDMQDPSMQAPSREQLQEGFGGQKINPMMASAIKKRFGFDPNALIEEENKRERSIDLTRPTQSTITRAQKSITAANDIIPQIEQLMNADNPSTLLNLPTGDMSKYKARTALLKDKLLSAFSLPQTDKALKEVDLMVSRGKYENAESYKERLGELLGEVRTARDNANQVLNASKVAPLGDSSGDRGAINNIGSGSSSENDPLGLLG